MQAGRHDPLDLEPPDVSGLVTEDDTPVDNLFSEKQQRLLTDALDSSWAGPPPSDDGLARPFVVAANVGLYASPRRPPLVPDVLLSADVQVAADLWKKENRVYCIWEFGKPPNVVIEIVSNRDGEELTRKRVEYARLGVSYYVVFDPKLYIAPRTLTLFERKGDLYFETSTRLEALGLGLTEWEGEWSHVHARWLRWTDANGQLIPTGAERAAREAERAAREAERADVAEARARRLAERLRALGEDPES